MDTFINWIVGIFVVVLVVFFVAALVASFGHFEDVWNAKTPAELKLACLSDWYKNAGIKDLPAQCLQFYKLGEIKTN